MRPKTANEYVELVRQALFELEDLRAAAEYDGESMGDALAFVDDLERGVRAVYDAMAAGRYEFADEDLPFMHIVQVADDRMLPFKNLLKVINETHRQGLDAD